MSDETSNSGIGWKKLGDGWVLFRASAKAPTYRITEEQHQKIQMIHLVWSLVVMILAGLFIAAFVQYSTGPISWQWIAALSGIALVCSFWLTSWTNGAVERVLCGAQRASTEVEFPAISEAIATGLKSVEDHTRADRRMSAWIGIWVLAAYSLVSIAGRAFGFVHVYGLPLLSAELAVYLLFSAGIVLGVSFWAKRRNNST